MAEDARTCPTPDRGWTCSHCGDYFEPTFVGQCRARAHFARALRETREQAYQRGLRDGLAARGPAMLEKAIRAVELEPELPEQPTPETLALIEADPMAACRLTVKLTKEAIAARLQGFFDHDA